MRVLVVGAGMTGSVIARVLAEKGYAVEVIDRRDHIAGNCFDYIDENGIRIHKYGPHIFHTSSRKVYQFLSRFTEWKNYEHRVVAKLSDGSLVPFPPNNKTLKYVEKSRLFETFYKPYSEKMWGIPINKLDEAILKRVRVQVGDEDRYFPSDIFQGFPELGYTALIHSILDHANISINLKTPFDSKLEKDFEFIFNSMAIDEYFNFDMGELPYRSIRFKQEIIKSKNITKHPVINFTDSSVFTRVTEWKNFPGHGDNDQVTVTTLEEPCDYRDNFYERYYPIIDESNTNRRLYENYKERIKPNMRFVGRCGTYTYLDMHQAVASALVVARDFLGYRREI